MQSVKSRPDLDPSESWMNPFCVLRKKTKLLPTGNIKQAAAIYIQGQTVMDSNLWLLMIIALLKNYSPIFC